jgi:hypothetical protein
MSPTFWQSLDATAIQEVCRLALEQPGQSRFEVVKVSNVLAAQVVLEGAEEMEVGRRQVGRVWWVGYRSPAQLLQLLAGGRSDVKPDIVVQQADLHSSSPVFLDGGGIQALPERWRHVIDSHKEHCY